MADLRNHIKNFSENVYKTGVYKITNNVNKKVYIGSSAAYHKNKKFKSGVYFRFTEHFGRLNKNKHQNKHLQFAWNKYGKDSFSFELIDNYSAKHVLFWEQIWINFYNSADKNFGYNKSPVTGTRLGIIQTKETREKISNSNMGRTMSKKSRKKLSNSLKKSAAFKKSIENNKKPVIQYSLSGEKIKEWNSAADAAKFLKLDASSITTVCKNNHLRTKNFQWRYKSDNIERLKTVTLQAKKILQLTLDDIIIKEWNSIGQACKELKLYSGNICNVCNGKRNHAGGFKWKYL